MTLEEIDKVFEGVRHSDLELTVGEVIGTGIDKEKNIEKKEILV